MLPYVKAGTKLYAQLAANHASDCFGRDIAINSIDQPPQITHQTWNDLADALGADPTAFWAPYSSY